MENEYKIEVNLTPHPHDSPEAPHFWCIYQYGGAFWHNVCCGWAKTPEEAFSEAKVAYDKMIQEGIPYEAT